MTELKQLPLHIVKDMDDLARLLSTKLEYHHLYCQFCKGRLTRYWLLKLVEMGVKSVSFCNGHTIYPTSELTYIKPMLKKR
ncbi:hypothetical protein ACP6H1_27335 [Vibrio harveyi]|uniref:hypothetical protein n=1 Tax=Vibrio harveyi TaxID=669 RepID=UPI003CF60218